MTKSSVDEGDSISYQNICSCKQCDHDLSRDCLKAGCKCCKEENHAMVMDGIEGFPRDDMAEGIGPEESGKQKTF